MTKQEFIDLLTRMDAQQAEALLDLAEENHVPLKALCHVYLHSPAYAQRTEQAALDAKFKDYEVIDFTELINRYRRTYPEGMTFFVNEIKADDIYKYIRTGGLLDHDGTYVTIGQTSGDGKNLNATFHMDVNDYNALYPASSIYEDEELFDWMKEKYGKQIDDTIVNFIHRHPNLDGGQVWIDEDRILPNLVVEGMPFSTAVSVCLQIPGLSNDELRHLLNDSNALHERMAEMRIQHADDGLHYKVNPYDAFFIEYGKLGYIQADDNRKVYRYGEELTRKTNDEAMDIITSRNFSVTRSGREMVLFRPEASIPHDRYLYFNPENKGIRTFEKIRLADDSEILVRDREVVKFEDLKDWMDITEKITDVKIIYGTNPMMRCKIDGVQQSGQLLTPDNMKYIQKKMEYVDNDKECSAFLRETAAQLFARPLLDSIRQDKSQGRKL